MCSSNFAEFRQFRFDEPSVILEASDSRARGCHIEFRSGATCRFGTVFAKLCARTPHAGHEFSLERPYSGDIPKVHAPAATQHRYCRSSGLPVAWQGGRVVCRWVGRSRGRRPGDPMGGGDPTRCGGLMDARRPTGACDPRVCGDPSGVGHTVGPGDPWIVAEDQPFKLAEAK